MKRTASILIALVFTLAIVLSGCKSGSGPQETASQAKPSESASQSPSAAKMSYQEWENSWEKAPWAELYPAPWDNMPKLTQEYTWRTTPDNVERNFDGKVYTEGWPIVKDPVTLKVLARQDPLMPDIENNLVFKNLEKKTGIHIEWTLVPTESFEEKKNLILSSGDLPDIILGGDISKVDEMRYGLAEKVFIPLTPLIDQYGTWIKKSYEARPEVKKVTTTPDGNIYSLPLIYYNYHVQYPVKGWINGSWLKKLNLQVPTTTEEYYNVLKAFKTKDPNGNGKADEIPLAGSPKGWFTDILGYFMNPFVMNYDNGANPTDDDHLYIENGQVKFSAVQPGYKEGLAYMKKLYDEKLFPAAAFTYDKQQFRQIGDNPNDDILGSFAGGYYAVAYNKMDGNPRADAIVPMPPLKGPNGSSFAFFTPFNYSPGEFVITSACKNPEAAIRWADWFFTPEADFAVQYGVLGQDWDYSAQGATNTFGDGQAVYKKLKELGDAPNDIFAAPMHLPGSEPLKEMYGALENAAGATGYDAKMSKITKDLYEGHQMPEILPAGMYVTPDEANELAQLTTAINNYVNEMSSKFILGKANLDKDWDRYVNEINKMNLARVLQIKQAAYDVFKTAK